MPGNRLLRADDKRYSLAVRCESVSEVRFEQPVIQLRWSSLPERFKTGGINLCQPFVLRPDVFAD